MTLSITFDYSLDSNGFFDAPERRAALEAAASRWTTHITDDFTDIQAGAQFTVRNPSTGAATKVVTTTAIDDIVIYAGAAATPFDGGTSSAARAGPTGTDLAGVAHSVRVASDFRGQGATRDFEPWAGTASFSSAVDWHFGIDTPAPSGKVDFLGVAVHEIGHVLGFGVTGTFQRLVSDDHFVGANVKTLSPDGVETTHDAGHFAQDGPIPSIMFPTNTDIRSPTALDFAALADIGYNVSFPGHSFTTTASLFPFQTAGVDQIIGTEFADVINALGGNDLVQGGGGNDIINGGDGNDQVSGGAGLDILNGGGGNDLLFDEGDGAIFEFGSPGGADFGTDQVIRFDPATQFIRFDPSVGFATAQDAFNGITRAVNTVDGGLLTELVTSSGTVQVFSATALTVDNFQISGAVRVEGGTSADRLVNNPMDEIFEGFDGRDTVVFASTRNAVETSFSGNTITTTGPQGKDSYTGIERFEFDDGALIFDIADALSITFDDGGVLPNFAYPLYAASLARTPDEGGLDFWSKFANSDRVQKVAFDPALGQTANVNAQVRLAAEFVVSPEFNTPDTATNEGFVRKLYSNFLNTDTPDTAGFNFWNGIYQQRLNDEIPNSILPAGVKIFDGGANDFVDMTAQQWAKAWMLRDFASHPDIFDRIEGDVSNGLFVAEPDVI